MASNRNEVPPTTAAVLKLRSSDGEEFQISSRAAVLSAKIMNLAEGKLGNNVIPLTDVDSETLPKILDYLNKHADSENLSDVELKEFDENFVTAKPISVLLHLAKVANYLDIKPLLYLVSEKAAVEIRNTSPQRIRQIFKDPSGGAEGDED